MIKCPECGRTYSNLVKVCPACKTVLNSQSQELPKYGSNENSSAVKPQTNKAAVVCSNCGATVETGAKFCDSCGSNIMEASNSMGQETTQTIAVPVPVPVVPVPAPPPTNANSNQNYQQSQVNINQSSQYKTNEENIFIQFFKDITSFNFNGRMNRAKYWKFAFIGFGLAIALVCVLFFLGIDNAFLYYLFGFVYTILRLPFAVRRLHDLNKSGWWAALCLIPYIDIIPNIYIGFFKGTDGPNQYGPDPLQQI